MPTTTPVPSPSKKVKLTLTSLLTNNLAFPTLGTHYLPEEVMGILKKVSTQTIIQRIKLMIEHGYISLKKTEIYQLLSKYKSSGKVYDELHKSG